MKHELTIKTVYNYFLAHYRYVIFYSKSKLGINLSWLLRKHIVEQYKYRLGKMDKECYNTGSCKECGCITTELQFSNLPCKGNCYGKMLTKKEWKYGLVKNSN